MHEYEQEYEHDFFTTSQNIRDQQLATKGLSTPPDFIASPLHRFVNPFSGAACHIPHGSQSTPILIAE